MGVGASLLNVLKAAGEAILSVAVEEVGPIESGALAALNTLITDLLAKAATAQTAKAATVAAPK